MTDFHGHKRARLVRAPGGTGGHAVHRSRWVMADSRTLLENGWIHAFEGRIQAVGRGNPGRVMKDLPGDAELVDHGSGLLMPPLVNAHTHLELSALHRALPFDLGFEAWVKALLEKREALGSQALIAGAETALDALEGPVGEVSTLGITLEPMRQAGTAGIFFQEQLGSRAMDDVTPEAGFPLSRSHAGHAPHTTAPELLTQLKAETRKAGLPFSLHLAESQAETDFIAGQRGSWYDFLLSRGIDPERWPIGNKSPVAYAAELGLLDAATLAVHLLRLEPGDLEILENKHPKICLCPRSNQNLHGRLPQVDLLVDKGLAPALGTDSLASCDSLSLLDEMAFVRKHFPHLAPQTLVDMSTINGARALGIDKDYGTLSPGKRAEFLYIQVRANHPEELIESVTHDAI